MKDEKKQTAVEWLISQLGKSKDFQRVINEVNQNSTIVIDILEQAKEMEKQQIIDAYTDEDNIQWDKQIRTRAAEQYYNETYEAKEM
jgi:hypothetical protein